MTLLTLALPLFIACGDKDDDTGGTTGDGGGDGGGGGGVSFSEEVHPILVAYGCADCHTDDTWHPGLILTDVATTYNSLLTDEPDDPSTWMAYVVAGDPDSSLLLHKLTEAEPSYGGDRMPKDGPYLTGAELMIIDTWIMQGAQDN